MQVGDLVVRNMGGLILKSMKGVILGIRQVGGATYYKIAWFNVDLVSDKWTDKEFCLFVRDLPDNSHPFGVNGHKDDNIIYYNYYPLSDAEDLF